MAVNRLSDDEEYIRWERARLKRQAEWAKALASAKREQAVKSWVPAKDLEIFARGIEETPAVAATREMGTILVLAGGPGTGKTTAASAWLLSRLDEESGWDGDDMPQWRGGRLLFVTAPKLSRWPRFGREGEEAMDRLLACSRLVVDDLGVEYLDEKGNLTSLLEELVNERYAHRRPTILTTNLDAEGFKARYGERVADRIREAGRFVSLGNESRRRAPEKVQEQDRRLPREKEDE